MINKHIVVHGKVQGVGFRCQATPCSGVTLPLYSDYLVGKFQIQKDHGK